MSNDLAGKCAVVTGGGGGIGREICLAFARQGMKVMVNDIGGGKDTVSFDPEPADRVVSEIKESGGTAVANYNSVTDFNASRKMIETCVELFGRIDILVNCAGGTGIAGSGITGERTRFWETSEEEWDGGIGLNLKGTFNTCRHALRYMVEQNWGRIINITSPSWLGIFTGAYTAGKGGVVSLTLGLAQELESEGLKITCNAIAPIAATRMNPGPKAARMWNRLFDLGLVNRQICEESINPPSPEHIPPIIVYLSTGHAAAINGQVFGASKGRIALYSYPTEIKGLYKDGVWSLEELIDRIPSSLAQNMNKTRG